MKKLILLLPLLLLLIPQTVFAVADPDIIEILSVSRYDDVAVVGDELYIVEYNLEYTSNPVDPAFDNYIGRMMDVLTELGNVRLYSITIPNDGYDHGLYSFYFPTGTPVAPGFTYRLEGNPAVFASPPVATTGTTTTKATDGLPPNEVLTLDMLAYMEEFETDWGLDIYEEAQGRKFTSLGEDYFTNVIPNLKTYAPTLFLANTTQPDYVEETFDLSYENSVRNYWSSSDYDQTLTNLANAVNMPRMVFTTIVLLAIAAAVAFWIIAQFQATEIGIFGAIIILGVGTFVGLTPMAFTATLVLFGILAIGYIFFYARSTS